MTKLPPSVIPHTHDADRLGQSQGRCAAGASFARYGSAIDTYSYNPTPDEIAQLDERQRAIYESAVSLMREADRMLAQVGAELCPEAGQFNW